MLKPILSHLKSPPRGWYALLVLAVAAHSLPNVQGQTFFKRYYRDQARQRVVVEPVRLPLPTTGPLRLSEREAIETALVNNLGLNVERHNAIFSFWEVEDLRSAYDPMLSFGLNWDRDTTPTASVLAGGPSVTDILTNYNLGYQQAFSTGTSIEASFSALRNRTTNFFSSLVPAINTSFRVLVRQRLLQGFGRIAPDYQIEIARNNLDITEQDFKRQVIETISQVQRVFWELQFALEDIQVREKSLELANTVLEQNQARYEVGSAARLEVVEAEAEVASRREELVRSQFNYRQLQDQLVTLIFSYTDPRELPTEIVPADPVTAPDPVSVPFDRLLAIAEEQNPLLQRTELEIANQEVGLELSRDRLKPSLDLVLGYEQFGLGGTQVIRDFSQGFLNPPVIAVIPGGFGDALSQLFSSDFYGYTVGFNLQLPIFNTQARAENAQALINLDRLRLQRESQKQTVALSIREALTQIEMNQARVDAAGATVRFARERLEGEEAKFEVGLGTTRELIEAQRDLVQAESVLVRARVDLIQSHAQLDQAVGNTLERFNIEIKPALETNVR